MARLLILRSLSVKICSLDIAVWFALGSCTRFRKAERFQLEPIVNYVGDFSPSCKISQIKASKQGLSQWVKRVLNPVMIFLPQGVLLFTLQRFVSHNQLLLWDCKIVLKLTWYSIALWNTSDDTRAHKTCRSYMVASADIVIFQLSLWWLFMLYTLRQL